MKAVEELWASEEFQDEKVNFIIAAYKEVVKGAQQKAASWYAELDLDFIDEILAPGEGKVMMDASKDIPVSTTANAPIEALASTP